MSKQVEATQQNELILSEVLNIQVKKVREERFPSAEDLVDSIPQRRIVLR